MTMETSSERPLHSSEFKYRFIENHFVSLPSQGNVFTLVPLVNYSSNNKILVGTLQGKIFCVEHQNESYIVTEDPLPNFPTEAEIVSMNAFNEESDKFTVVVTFMTGGITSEYFILFFLRLSFNQIGGSESLHSPLSIQLSYIPYGVFFFPIYSHGAKEIICLLCGSDNSIHLFRRSQVKDFIEEPSCELFPEFELVENVTLHLDIRYTESGTSRLTAMCGEDGKISLFNVFINDFGQSEVKGSHSIQFDFPISALRIFSLSNEAATPLIVMATAVESCFIYSCSDKSGQVTKFTRQHKLPESDNFDVVTCCLVCDVDFDGKNEVILGTYGQVILIYKEIKLDETTTKWILNQTLSIPSPVLSMVFMDILNDGVKELIVQTMSALHIFQCDPLQVSRLIRQRLQLHINKRNPTEQ